MDGINASSVKSGWEEIINTTNNYPELSGYIPLEILFTPDMISLASEETAKHFHDRKDTIAFMKARWLNSQILSDKIINGEFKANYYKQITINERGKARLIKPPTFECKIVQKLLSTFILRPYLEANMIEHSYATVKGRGTDKLYSDLVIGLNEAIKHKNKYIVLTDFSNYFGSIDTRELENRVFRSYIHNEQMIQLLMKFFPDEKGMVLGNEVSQLPASFYPNPIDQFITVTLMNPYYYRYMDDTLCVVKNKKEVKEHIETFKTMSNVLKLNVKDEKIQVIRMGTDFVFCKERFFFNKKTGHYYQMINPKRIRTEKRKINAITDIDELSMQYNGVRGSIRNHPNSYKSLIYLDNLYNKKHRELLKGL